MGSGTRLSGGDRLTSPARLSQASFTSSDPNPPLFLGLPYQWHHLSRSSLWWWVSRLSWTLGQSWLMVWGEVPKLGPAQSRGKLAHEWGRMGTGQGTTKVELSRCFVLNDEEVDEERREVIVAEV